MRTKTFWWFKDRGQNYFVRNTNTMVQDILWKADSHSVFQTVASFLYGTWSFITVLTKAYHWTLSWANWIQFAPLIPVSLRYSLMLSSHLRLGLPSGLTGFSAFAATEFDVIFSGYQLCQVTVLNQRFKGCRYVLHSLWMWKGLCWADWTYHQGQTQRTRDMSTWTNRRHQQWQSIR
jgi:hypothetical protein